MRKRCHLVAAALALVAGLCAGNAGAADRMVGIVPSDGVAMLVKAFVLSAGASITGVQFESNDDSTVFPEVALYRGPLTALSGATPVAYATDVSETSTGMVTVVWADPVSVTDDGTYYVGVCLPQGEEKEGPGVGAAIGADDIASPNGSYIAGGEDRTLEPVRADLSVSLTLGASMGGGAFQAAAPPSEGSDEVGITTHLRPQAVPGGAKIAFGVAHDGPVSLLVYDVAGRVVRSLVQGDLSRGLYERGWDRRDARGATVSAGVYFVQLRAGADVLSEKLVLVH